MVLPVFFLVILGIAEFGRAFMVEHLLADAARMGARMSVVEGSSNSKVKDFVKDHCGRVLGIKSDKVSIAIDPSLSEATAGTMCTISVSVAFDDVDFLPGSFLRGAKLSGSCTMEHE